jgi:RNA polymerase sporulation-specific sigma factor
MSNNTKERIILAQQGNEEEFNALVKENIALVKSIAKRFVDRGADFEDLVQIGSIGLMRAIRGFNFEFGTALSTYAVPMISGEIKRFLRDDGLLKVGREIKANAAKIRRYSSEFEAREGRTPTTLEVSEALNLSLEDITFALDATQVPTALEWEDEDGESHELCIGVDEEGENIDRIALREAMKRLLPEEEMLIRLRYYKGLTQQKTAELLGLTQVKVSRDEKKICAKLKSWLE